MRIDVFKKKQKNENSSNLKLKYIALFFWVKYK